MKSLTLFKRAFEGSQSFSDPWAGSARLHVAESSTHAISPVLIRCDVSPSEASRVISPCHINMTKPSYSRLFSRVRVPVGFLGAIAYFAFAKPTLVSILAGGGLAFIGVLWRAWAAGMIRKNAVLSRDGPYALSRNPLYFGSFVIAAGFGWASHRWIVFLAVLVLFIVTYWPVMRREEQELEALFGKAFLDYAKEVPLFIPWRWSIRALRSETVFDWAQYMKNREYNALLGFLAAVGLLFVIKYLRG